MRRAGGSLALLLLAVAASASAESTLLMPLSGMGEAGEKPVYWEFKLDTGRGSGAWQRIVVPSCWEQQGFGTYYYGTQGRGKPDDDPVIPKETGTYRRSFTLPSSWRGREIHLVFEAAMTDTSVWINGQSAGPVHQGGFYRFSYDITKLVRAGSNDLEVRVAKESSNKSVNHAERRGDYWTFGGIYRPVWLEARPATHITWTAIDARADGGFFARAHLNRAPEAPTALDVRITDAGGKPLGEALTTVVNGTEVAVRGVFPAPATWTAETPNLYTATFRLRDGAPDAPRTRHEKRERFGFRTLEVRANDGVYLNGTKVVLKGINRHSFRPATGRTLTRAENYADARLIKSANMNAVRMSHYPPDPAFLEAADELGLYVLDELAGWQGYYDAPTGARLIGQIVRRDVNHPSVLFWDNGNEGGWNREVDAEFHRWDPQRRPVLHPWATHSAINTDHYENYDSTVRLSAGPEIFMPTEFLHGLYDGGIGAGFRDYWNVMGRSPTVAGGFFWVFADEGIARTDRGGKIDNVGNQAPDGIVGPNHEKEGSFFAVREIWSPVQVSGLKLEQGKLGMRLENHYDFTDLARCTLRWRVLQLPGPSDRGPERVLASGRAPLPAVPPRGGVDWGIDIARRELAHHEMVEIAIDDPQGRELWTWTLRGEPPVLRVRTPSSQNIRRDGRRVTAGKYTLEFDAATGELTGLSRGARALPLKGPHLIGWQRIAKQRNFAPLAPPPVLRRLTLAPAGDPGVIARAEYAGALREVTWSLRESALLVSYRLEWRGAADILGVGFEFPEERVLGKRWLGAGPYRIWKNRTAGARFGFHEAAYSRAVPGESFEYPEFHGFFGEWDWLEMRTRDGNVVLRNLSGVPAFGLYTPPGGAQPVLELPPLGWSFLHAIPAIGTKFALADVLGPQSQPAVVDGVVEGAIELTID